MKYKSNDNASCTKITPVALQANNDNVSAKLKPYQASVTKFCEKATRKTLRQKVQTVIETTKATVIVIGMIASYLISLKGERR